MQTRKALRGLGRGQYELGDGPLADVATALAAAVNDREADRLDRAAARGGAGPIHAALRRVAQQYAAELLVDSTAPAVMRADLHSVLKAAHDAAGGEDRGLRMAMAHAYRLWHKDPAGVATVGEVAKLRATYAEQYPRSRVAEVIDTEVPKIGFNTLPLRRLVAVAAEIARDVAKGHDVQEAYEHAVERHALAGTTPDALRARALVRSLVEAQLDDADPSDESELELEPGDDAEISMLNGDDDGAADEGEPSVEVESPITGEPLMIELSQPEAEPAESEPAADVLPDDVHRMDMVGQLSDFIDDGDVDSSPGMELDDAEPTSEAEPAEAVVTMADPTDPQGGRLEVSVRAVEPPAGGDAVELGGGGGAPAGMPPGDVRSAAEDDEDDDEADPEAGDFDEAGPPWGEDHPPWREAKGKGMSKCSRCNRTADKCECDDSRSAWVVYAYSKGVRGAEPIDEFEASGMAAALRRLATFGVRGEIRSTATALANEALVVLDEARGDYLLVSAAKDKRSKGKLPGFPSPAISKRPGDAVSVGSDGGAILKAAEIEARVLSGETVRLGEWSLRVNDDADVELRKGKGHARTASLSHLDDMIATLIASASFKAPNTSAQSDTAHAPAWSGRYAEVARFAHRCAACGTTNHYVMPEVAADLSCDCGFTTVASEVDADPTGYWIVTDVPGGSDRERVINAKRILAAMQKDVPSVTGLLRKDGKLQLDVGDESATARLRRILEDRYGVTAYTMSPAEEAAARAAQLAGPPPGPGAEPLPGGPEGGDEGAPLPVDDPMMGAGADPMMGPPGMGGGLGVPGADLFGGTSLSPDESDAVRAALTHWRNQGLGPATALDKLLSQYKELIDRYGEETDHNRHLIEAEAMKLAAEVWMKPAVMDVETGNGSGGMGGPVMGGPPMMGGGMPPMGGPPMGGPPGAPPMGPPPGPGAGGPPPELGASAAAKAAAGPLGPDSEKGHAGPAPKINTRVAPQGKFSNPSLGPDSEGKNPFKVPAISKPGKPDAAGTSFSDPNLGSDSEANEPKVFDVKLGK